MKRSKILLLITAGAIIAACIIAALQFGETSPMLASGSAVLDEKMAQAARNTQYLFIVVHDAESTLPMPYGAMRIKLDVQPQPGEIYKFLLTKERLSAMMQDRPLPKRLRLKARLDVDGQGGPDQSGDLVGTLDNVTLGATDVKIVIDKQVL